MLTLKLFKRGIVLLALFALLGIFLPGTSLAQEAEGPTINLQYASFDPLKALPDLPESLRAPEASTGPALYLLQFQGPVLDEWKAAVEASGAVLYGYVPDYAFLARLDSSSLAQVQSLPFVRWVGAYQPAFRLSPAAAAAASAAAAAEQAGDLSSSPFVTVSVMTLPGADLAGLTGAMQALNGEVLGQAENEIAGYLRVKLPAAQLARLAGLDRVVWVEFYQSPVLMNDKGGGYVMGAEAVRAGLGLFGKDQIVAVADSGLDTGNPATIHPDLQGRIKIAHALGRPNDWADYVGHGTHVVGSVLGSGLVSGSNPGAHDYGGRYSGVAPEAKLVFQGLGDPTGGLGGIPNDEGQLMREAYLDGARIHTNSWGRQPSPSQGEPAGAYAAESQQVDLAMWQLKDLLVLFSAGNSGQDANGDGVVDLGSLGIPATAKNILTVGASENDRPTIKESWNGFGFDANPIAGDLQANNINGMAAFSSRGPAQDGRIKPDVAAPGTFIASLRTHQYVFNDTLEGNLSGYGKGTLNGGAGGSWEVSGEAHSGSHAWREAQNSCNNDQGANILMSPPFNARIAGSAISVSFFHKYSLSANDNLLVLLLNPDTNEIIGKRFSFSTPQNSYAPFDATLSIYSFTQGTDLPTQVRLLLGIECGPGSNSVWVVDDLRVNGASWGTLSSVGLAQPGDTLDENYLMEGGTSMATPLTAGAAAIVREWLQRFQSLANPSGALIKAVLLNGASDMSPGQYGSNPSTQEIPATRPNNVSGWGRVNLAGSLNPPVPRQVWVKDNPTGLQTGGQVTYTLTVRAPKAGTALDELSADPAELEASAALVAQSARPLQAISPEALQGEPGAALELAPDATTQVLQNPGFESGAWTPWAHSTDTALVNTGAHSGAWAAHIGGVESVDFITPTLATFAQPVSIPADATAISLSFWYQLDTMETVSNSDFLCFGAWDNSGNAVWGYCPVDFGVSGSTSWTHLIYTLTTADLADIKGKSIQFGFQTQNDFLDPSAAFIDDTSLTITRGVTPPPPTGTAGPFRVTLAWTDYPGQPYSSRQLVNNLDLEIIGPDGTHYFGNTGIYGSGSSCLRNGQWDQCNNVEGIYLPKAQLGAYTVIVHAVNVPQGPQPYAIVASGDCINKACSPLHAIYLPVLRK